MDPLLDPLHNATAQYIADMMNNQQTSHLSQQPYILDWVEMNRFELTSATPPIDPKIRYQKGDRIRFSSANLSSHLYNYISDVTTRVFLIGEGISTAALLPRAFQSVRLYPYLYPGFFTYGVPNPIDLAPGITLTGIVSSGTSKSTMFGNMVVLKLAGVSFPITGITGTANYVGIKLPVQTPIITGTASRVPLYLTNGTDVDGIGEIYLVGSDYYLKIQKKDLTNFANATLQISGTLVYYVL